VISLPKDWLNRNNLDKGNYVSLDVRDGSLVVHPESNLREEDVRIIKIVIEADENIDSIIRRIIGAYLDGFTIIKLRSTGIFSVEQQKAIRQIVSTLYMMIIESETSNIVLETLIDESKVSVSSGVERMHLITSSMLRDILTSIRNWDKVLARTVASLEDDVDQLMFFIIRIIRGVVVSPSLANLLGLDNLDCLDYQTLVHRIEQIADHATSIANSVISLIDSEISIPENVMTTLIKSAEIAFTSYDMAVQCYLSKDIEPTNEIIDKQKEIEDLYGGITPLPYCGRPNETSVLSDVITIRECVMKISNCTADIAELTIDRTYKSKKVSVRD
jgi:phosphate uptake regulator